MWTASLLASVRPRGLPVGRCAQVIAVLSVVFVLQEQSRPVQALKAGRRGKQQVATEAPVNSGPGDQAGDKKVRRGPSGPGPTIGLLDPDIMARLASSADATRTLNRFSGLAALSRMQNTAYQAVGLAASASTLNRPILNNRAAVGAERMLIQPQYTEKVAAPKIIDNDGREWRADYAPGYLYLPGVGDAIGGYMLGRILIKRLYNLTDPKACCADCYCSGPAGNRSAPWYLDDYVPYRYRYHYMEELVRNISAVQAAEQAQAALTSRPADTAAPPTDLCVLERWNRELPFSELPNMLLTFLANDDISGQDTVAKAQFFNISLERARQAYLLQDKHSDSIFKIYDKFEELSGCSGPATPTDAPTTTTRAPAVSAVPRPPTTRRPPPWYALALAQWSELVDTGDQSICGLTGIEKPAGCDYYAASITDKDPFEIALDYLERVYSPSGRNGDKMLQELVQSAKACYQLRAPAVAPGTPETADGSVNRARPSSSLIGCLDFSLGTGQARNLTVPASIFANEEICQRFLTPELSRCATEGALLGCREQDIINLDVFARNFYLCVEPVDQSVVVRVSSQKRTARQEARSRCAPSTLDATCAAARTGKGPWTAIVLAASVIALRG